MQRRERPLGSESCSVFVCFYFISTYWYTCSIENGRSALKVGCDLFAFYCILT